MKQLHTKRNLPTFNANYYKNSFNKNRVTCIRMIELTKSWLFYLNDVHHRPRCEKFPQSRYSHTRTFHSPFFCSCQEKLREKPKSYFTILTEMYGKRFFWAVERRVPYGIAIVSVFRISCNFSCSRHYMLNTLSLLYGVGKWTTFKTNKKSGKNGQKWWKKCVT